MDLDQIKSKLNNLQNASKGSGEKKDYSKIFWSPKVGEHEIRIVPSAYNQNNPFTEIKVYYGIGPNKVMISPLNFGEKDPIFLFAEGLKAEYNKENYYIFEGPFDSCFVKNGLAIGGITTSRTLFSGIQEEQLDKILLLNRIWVLDSQYQDEAAREKSRILLEENEQVFLWPKEYGEKYKDFNDIAIAKKLNEISESFILENTVSGISGLIKLAQIK